MREKKLKASFTVEMSVIVPMIMMILLLSVWTVFYEHDKNVISAAAYETATTGSLKSWRKEGVKEAELLALLKERIGHKCILLKPRNLSVEISDREIVVRGSAGFKYMKTSVSQKAVITKPEEYIRKKRRF